jgi:hypothetical protein
MSMSLRTNTSCCINKKHCNIAIGCCHCHIARVLLMSGRISDKDTATIWQVHVTVSHINRDALLAFCFEPISQERVVDFPNRDSRATSTCAFRILELITRNAFSLDKQATNERRLAVVY